MIRRWMIACLLLMAVPMLAPAPGAHAAATYDGTSSSEQQKALASINKIRQQMGLAEVKLDSALNTAAVNHARYANAHYAIASEGDLSSEKKGLEFYTQPTTKERAVAAGYNAADKQILETVYIKERAYDQNDMALEIRELSFAHSKREVMLTPGVTDLGIARVGKATVIVGAAKAKDDTATPVAASVFPYDGMKNVW
ncbi:CAP domain-containing protein [Paenibacillaceae bacterium]|nr:CAP domain-containing protein [Paenibacillaceae bacterium]